MQARKDAVGALVRRTSGKGFLAPVSLMKKFIREELKRTPKNKDLMFIGNPRLKSEAQLLTKLLEKQRRDYLVVSISLPVAEIRARSLKRMRDDQDWKYVDNRIKMYRLQISKTLSYFKAKGKLRMVNGNRHIQIVANDILKLIHDHQRSQANRITKRKRPHSG